MARFNPSAQVVTSAVVRLVMEVDTNSTKQQVVLDYNWSVAGTTPTPADLAAFVTAWETAHQTLFLACLSPLTELSQVSAAEIHYGITPTLVLPYAPATVGTAGATNLPLSMAAVLQKKSALKGQHGRGRVSMPAVPNTFTTPAVDANVLNATGIAAYLALATQLVLPVVAGGNNWTMGISTRPTPPVVLVDRFVACNAMTVNVVLGSLDRRKPGRGI